MATLCKGVSGRRPSMVLTHSGFPSDSTLLISFNFLGFWKVVFFFSFLVPSKPNSVLNDKNDV